jgi:hypothetical protein
MRVIVFLLLFCTTAYAAFDTNNAQEQGQLQGQAQAAISLQGQAQKASNDQAVSVGGDSEETKVYANTWPTTHGDQGSSNMNAYSIFGGIGITETKEYRVCIEKLQVIENLGKTGVLTKDEVITESLTAWEQLKKSTRPERWLGFGFRTSGRNLLNGMGLLSWPSLRPSETK